MRLRRRHSSLLVMLVLPLSFAACTREQPPEETGQPADLPAPTPAPAEQPMTAQFTALNNSGVTGQIEVAAAPGEQTRVKVTLIGAPTAGVHQGHIHAGTCEALGAPVVELQPITIGEGGTGESESTVAVAPATAMNGQHIVIYHEAGGTPGAPVTCAAIPAHM